MDEWDFDWLGALVCIALGLDCVVQRKEICEWVIFVAEGLSNFDMNCKNVEFPSLCSAQKK